jgi:hypothetical protein
MKNGVILLLLELFVNCALSQAPQGFSYQSIVRGNQGQLLINSEVSALISITRDSVGGELVYQELHGSGVQTNANGLLNLVIGQGVPQWSTVFSQINWGDGPYFVQVAIDPNGGSDFSISAASQLLSVPYALFAANTGGGDLPQGANEGDILHWNDNSWQILPLGGNYQKLCVCQGQLRWAPYQPSVNTVMAVYDVTESSARMEVELLDNGCDEGGPCIIYSTNPNPTIENAQGSRCAVTNLLSPFAEPGVYSVQLSNLQPATTYYARAYMGNHIAQDYGDVFTFTTQVFELPEIVLNSVTLERSEYDSIDGYSNGYDSLPQFHFYGDFSLSLLSTGDAPNADIGVVWSYHENPTLADNLLQQNFGQNAPVGNYTTTMEWTWLSEPLMLPNTNVYFSAFAIVNADTVYSTPVMIHTAGSEGNIGPAGGYIVLDKGNYIDGWRYMEMAPVNVSDSAQWGCYGSFLNTLIYQNFDTGFRTDLGFGEDNSEYIVQFCSDPTSAAFQCVNWTYGSFNDWFLPSLRELSVLITSSNELPSIPNLSGSYWTSNEEQEFFSQNGFNALYGNQNFVGAIMSKSTNLSVRALRKY